MTSYGISIHPTGGSHVLGIAVATVIGGLFILAKNL